ncbi:hypothetical protein SISSUDRAFT_203281 [Sistotremastrum suecicum HHB10207 ss-3]|uniref:GATA-type domain-containing protein n=1 Tax=Sistotremastrum suecicum HHB10207 ss-3 TaxID=1314776 RepID=A0A166GL44_9AGAM|nr:hypothetical protein SISSUDRAFT_203281 [Sistotremastrum suecicum HHB10207 ss-3]
MDAQRRAIAEKDMQMIKSKRQAGLISGVAPPGGQTSSGAAPSGNGGSNAAAQSAGTGASVGVGMERAPKKYRKRGRATPPGKCHSCNIKETPEWRRGPDGARTLCNACGLHYAKLVRKRDKTITIIPPGSANNASTSNAASSSGAGNSGNAYNTPAPPTSQTIIHPAANRNNSNSPHTSQASNQPPIDVEMVRASARLGTSTSSHGNENTPRPSSSSMGNHPMKQDGSGTPPLHNNHHSNSNNGNGNGHSRGASNAESYKAPAGRVPSDHGYPGSGPSSGSAWNSNPTPSSAGGSRQGVRAGDSRS